MEKIKKKLKMPHAYAIIILLILFCVILTWILPAGTFETVYNEELDRELVVAGSYTPVEPSPVGPWGFFESLYAGMVNASEIIFFVIFASAYVFLLMKTGSLNALVGSLLRSLGNRDHLIIPIIMLVFGIAGTTIGAYEEVYGLIPAFIVMAITLGYDRIVGGAMVFVGMATGFAAAILNPFTIGLASAVAGIPMMNNKILIFRVVAFCLFMTLSISYVMWYAHRIKKDHTKSYLFGVPEKLLTKDILTREEVIALPFTIRQKITLWTFLILIIAMAVGISVYGFYLEELAALFIIGFFITGIINHMSVSDIADSFVESAESAMYGALLIGLSYSIEVVMSSGNIIDTVVLSLSNLVGSLPSSMAAVGMLAGQNIINFFIPSGTGQAVVVMPIMAPLADLVGISREVAVTAYQFGDGFSNMFWPTAVAVECGIMGIGLDKWYRFITPLFIMMFILQAILISVGVVIGI
ncbi:MAG: TIGR00366 family protein [Anaerovorax sp.]|nr:TIGR00366 family protein [Anaerovorax sp.]